MRYVQLDEALAIIERRGWGPVRDVGLLDSALVRPAASAFGGDAYPTFRRKAAALLHSLAGIHLLVNGNERLALHLTHLFVYMNGAHLALTQDQAVDLIVDVAKGLDDLDVIEARLLHQPRLDG